MIYRLYEQLPHSAPRGLSQAASRRMSLCAESIGVRTFGIARHALMNAGELMT